MSCALFNVMVGPSTFPQGTDEAHAGLVVYSMVQDFMLRVKAGSSQPATDEASTGSQLISDGAEHASGIHAAGEGGQQSAC